MDNGERESHDDKMEKASFASSDHWKALATTGEESELADASVEKIFESREVPPWQKQLTFRAFFVSFILTILFSFIVMKLNLTAGIIPSLNVAAGLLGFFFVKTWTKFLEKSGLLKQPFTRQENTVIQTCVVASSGIAFSGGFGSYLFGMSEEIAKSLGETYSSQDVKTLSLDWMIGFLFVVSFLGLFSIVPLRKLQKDIDHPCNEVADCISIQPCGSYFELETFVNHASVAMNLYYQLMARDKWNCYFNNFGFIVLTNPSYGGCIYPNYTK
ncbi:Probable metal-nicotianamine transporter ysl5 [Ancistrocladus abbreviatus]